MCKPQIYNLFKAEERCDVDKGKYGSKQANGPGNIDGWLTSAVVSLNTRREPSQTADFSSDVKVNQDDHRQVVVQSGEQESDLMRLLLGSLNHRMISELLAKREAMEAAS